LRIVDAAWTPLGSLAILAFIALLTIAVKLALDGFLPTEIGFALRATGDSERMITAQGVNTERMKLLGLALSNELVALSGAVVAQYSGFADVGIGIGTIVTGLAAVIIGGSLIRSSRVGWMTTSVLVGSLVYRIAVALALRYRHVVGFQPSDLS
jgi:putative ABC transport system permease protein